MIPNYQKKIWHKNNHHLKKYKWERTQTFQSIQMELKFESPSFQK